MCFLLKVLCKRKLSVKNGGLVAIACFRTNKHTSSDTTKHCNFCWAYAPKHMLK